MGIECDKEYVRYEDMSSEGQLQMMMQGRGGHDIVLTVWTNEGAATIEFCTMSNGGGDSPAVYEALLALMAAIETDNRNRPQQRIE